MPEKTSPTLQPGHSYLSVVAPVPVELCKLINEWNSKYGDEPATIGNHITVLISEATDNFEAAKSLSSVDLDLSPIEVELGAPQTFLPATPVTYFPLVWGTAGLTEAHQALQKVAGESASPFVYVPHLTLSHRLEEEQLADAQDFFTTIPENLRKFTVEEFRVYSNVDGEWELLSTLALK